MVTSILSFLFGVALGYLTWVIQRRAERGALPDLREQNDTLAQITALEAECTRLREEQKKLWDTVYSELQLPTRADVRARAAEEFRPVIRDLAAEYAEKHRLEIERAVLRGNGFELTRCSQQLYAQMQNAHPSQLGR